jgi:hypothetical protein
VKIELGSQVLAWRRIWIPDFAMVTRFKHILAGSIKQINRLRRLVSNSGELGYVPFTAVGAELLFDVFSRRYEHGATLVTSNLPFDEWTSVFGSERLTGALLDRLTHHVHILEMNGDSYRLSASKKRARKAASMTET